MKLLAVSLMCSLSLVQGIHTTLPSLDDLKNLPKEELRRHITAEKKHLEALTARSIAKIETLKKDPLSEQQLIKECAYRFLIKWRIIGLNTIPTKQTSVNRMRKSIAAYLSEAERKECLMKSTTPLNNVQRSHSANLHTKHSPYTSASRSLSAPTMHSEKTPTQHSLSTVTETNKSSIDLLFS